MSLPHKAHYRQDDSQNIVTKPNILYVNGILHQLEYIQMFSIIETKSFSYSQEHEIKFTIGVIQNLFNELKIND